MNLFICATPLHCLLSKALMKKRNLEKKECQLFYFSDHNKNQEIHKKYYSLLSEYCDISDYLDIEKSFSSYISYIKDTFKNKKFESVFVANVDKMIIHLILSYISIEKLYSYDDGIGNLVKSSCFYKKKNKNILTDIKYFFRGNRYNLEKVKRKITCHYSIYKKNENIIKNIEWVDPSTVFNFNTNTRNNFHTSKKSAIVILGTVFDELLEDKKNKGNLLNALQIFINKNSDNEIYYIPHPRCHEVKLNNVIEYSEHDIAEVILLRISNNYEQLNVYSFISTAQFNIENQKIKNSYFISSLFRKGIEEYTSLCDEFNFTPYNIDIE
ncbi:hypothetical protein H4F45_01910 [Pectobacterium brasiliense]|uniref:CMP-N-acetylneuraminate-beta-galactosamide-alpha-2, 3-sialyltransferase n=1 Tax=Pectobacterium brasiliense TaxID=180957 RepID=A0AAE3BE64_9GAMM|nr:glycosyltransferase family 52 [Pectobacterium brasiliense]MBN3050260.1 hypothetical protein [Pectobacterium brasiliense]